MRTQGKADETVEGPAHPRVVVSRRATAPGLRPVETQMLRLQQAAGNQAVTGFVQRLVEQAQERSPDRDGDQLVDCAPNP